MNQSLSNANTNRNPRAARVQFLQLVADIKAEVGNHVVGMDRHVELMLVAFLAGGHVLLESPPGLGKTTLAKTLSDVMGLAFRRIQFTPDLMPFDITGGERPTRSDGGSVELAFSPGPIFASFVLADEINRAPPKTQAALLEAMAEGQVTIASLGTSMPLPKPFFVVATQNPVEMEGTYELPEAQLDRFMLKLNIEVPSQIHFADLIEQQARRHVDSVAVRPVVAEFFRAMTGDPQAGGQAFHTLAGHVLRTMPEFTHYRAVADLVRLTNLRRLSPQKPDRRTSNDLFPGIASELQQRVWTQVAEGCSSRAALALVRAAQVLALLDDRGVADWDHIRQVVAPVLGHRLVPTFDGNHLRDPAQAARLLEELCDAVVH